MRIGGVREILSCVRKKRQLNRKILNIQKMPRGSTAGHFYDRSYQSDARSLSMDSCLGFASTDHLGPLAYISASSARAAGTSIP